MEHEVKIRLALEDLQNAALPENETVFELKIDERDGKWEVNCILGPFAGRVEEHENYPSSYVIPTHDLQFESKQKAFEFAKSLNEILVDRGKQPTQPIENLLEDY